MKQLKTTMFLLLAMFCVAQPVFATVESTNNIATFSKQYNAPADLQNLTPQMAQMNLDQFLQLTPSKYKEMTGERLGIKKSLQLKAAQKFIKAKRAGDPEISKGLYVVLAILGWAWVVMGLKDDWKGSDWITSLILYVLCWLPGVIHAFVKMNKYYS